MTTIARWFLALVSACGALAAQAQEKVIIVFKASDGMTFTETQRFEKSVFERNSQPRSTSVVSRGHYTVRKTPAGYSVTLKPVKPVDYTPSEEVAALAAGILTNVRVRYELSDTGQLTDIVGAEQALGEMESALPAEGRPIFRAMGLTPAALRRQLAMEWRLRDLFLVAGNSGRPMNLGVQVENPDAMLPSALAGAFKATSTLRSKGPLACGGSQCVVIEASGSSRDPALGTVLANTMSAMMEGMFKQFAPKGQPVPQIPKLLVSEPYEKVRLERTIDAATGLYHSFVQQHEVTARFSVPEQSSDSMPVRITVLRRYTYAYNN